MKTYRRDKVGDNCIVVRHRPHILPPSWSKVSWLGYLWSEQFRTHALLLKYKWRPCPVDNGMAAGLESGAIKRIVVKTFPLPEVAEALRYLVEGRHFGRVVLAV